MQSPALSSEEKCDGLNGGVVNRILWKGSMQYISAGLVILSLIAAFGLGFLIPLRYGPHVAGYIGGMLAGSSITLLAGVMVGYLVAGQGEDWLGTAFGVPIGLFIGCFSAVVLLNYFFGSLGLGIVTLLTRKWM
jgi:hypothetical protein